MLNRWVAIFVVVWLGACTRPMAQGQIFEGSRHKIGLQAGYGNQSLLNVSYDYRVIFTQIQYHWAFLRREKWGLELLIQPQYNTTEYAHVDGYAYPTPGSEFGVNIGALIRRNFFDDLASVYFLGSLGPHWISGAPERQVPGFIFSDNLLIGANLRLYESVYLDARFGYRHLSNANLKKPNLGINNTVFTIGFFIAL